MIKMSIPAPDIEGDWHTYEGPRGNIGFQIRPIFQEKRDAINTKHARYELKKDPETGERVRVLTQESSRAILDETIDWMVQNIRGVEVTDPKGAVIPNTERRAKLHVIHNSETEMLAFVTKIAKEAAFEIEKAKEERTGNC